MWMSTKSELFDETGLYFRMWMILGTFPLISMSFYENISGVPSPEGLYIHNTERQMKIRKDFASSTVR